MDITHLINARLRGRTSLILGAGQAPRLASQALCHGNTLHACLEVSPQTKPDGRLQRGLSRSQRAGEHRKTPKSTQRQPGAQGGLGRGAESRPRRGPPPRAVSTRRAPGTSQLSGRRQPRRHCHQRPLLLLLTPPGPHQFAIAPRCLLSARSFFPNTPTDAGAGLPSTPHGAPGTGLRGGGGGNSAPFRR